MSTKQHGTLNIVGSESKPVRSINGKANPAVTSAKNTNPMTDKHKPLLLSLQKMEEKNAHLEELLEDARKKLSEAIATNTRFLRIVAHDLRNPFATTITILGLLKESFDDRNEAETKQLINTATNSAIKALNLLENLLTWSMAQNIEKTFNPVKINLRELVINEIVCFNTSAALKQIDIDQSIALNMHVTADYEMVKTIFRNMISNAIKYTNTGGKIHITATEGKKFVKIEVRDNGIGMSQSTKEKLFKIDEFNSISGTSNEQGSGFGLLFCKEFIDMHGGNIWVESEPGKGSKFKFTLPHYI